MSFLHNVVFICGCIAIIAIVGLLWEYVSEIRRHFKFNTPMQWNPLKMFNEFLKIHLKKYHLGRIAHTMTWVVIIIGILYLIGKLFWH